VQLVSVEHVMVMRQRRRRIGRAQLRVLLVVGLALASVIAASAQEHPYDVDTALVREVVRRVAVDPTTYAPTIVVHTARQLDWSSSQPLFALGYVEANPRYTTTGLPAGPPVPYAVGNRRIVGDTVGLLAKSAVNNTASAVIERMLIARAPQHRRLIRTLGWIERASFGAYWAQRLSSRHFHQWRENERLARQLGAR
jgi:hypothetical protein